MRYRSFLLTLLLTATLAHAESMRCFKRFDRKIKALNNIQVTMSGPNKLKSKISPVQLKLIAKNKKG